MLQGLFLSICTLEKVVAFSMSPIWARWNFARQWFAARRADRTGAPDSGRLESLGAGRQRYGFFTVPGGGILDDLMVANLSDRILLVVNASRKKDDLEHYGSGLSDRCSVTELPDRALLALQGPKAENALASLIPAVTAMRFMDVMDAEYCGSRLPFRARVIRAKTVLRSRSASELADAFARRSWTTRTCARSAWAHGTACGSKRVSASMAPTSLIRRL